MNATSAQLRRDIADRLEQEVTEWVCLYSGTGGDTEVWWVRNVERTTPEQLDIKVARKGLPPRYFAVRVREVTG